MIRVIHQGIRLYIDPADVLYAQRQGDEHDAVARLHGGAVKLPCKTSLSLLAGKYPHLVLVHRNALVNRDFIKSVVPLARRADGCTVILKNDVQIHGSRRFYTDWLADPCRALAA